MTSASRARPRPCRICQEAFLEPAHLALHRGRAHPDELEAGEQAAYDVALAEEQAWLDTFRRHTRAALAALPVLLLYGLLIVAAIEYGVNPAMAALPAPGAFVFFALIYYLAYTHER